MGVSRRIDDEKERERLRQAAKNIKPSGMGLIVRTVAAGMEEDEFAQDMDFCCDYIRLSSDAVVP